MKTLFPLAAMVALLLFQTFSAAATGEPASLSYIDDALSTLPQDKAEAFHTAMKAAHQRNKSLYEQMHKLHEDIQAILKAPHYDKAAFIAKDIEIQQLHDKVADNLSMAFASALEPLSQSERTEMADAIVKEHEMERTQKAK